MDEDETEIWKRILGLKREGKVTVRINMKGT